jgi:tetratricopeptide (TPR) repeat protein
MVGRAGSLLIVGALLRVAPALAQTEAAAAGSGENASSDRARASFSEGLRHLRVEHWAEAEVAFRRSLELVPRASTRYNLALVLFKQRRARESLAQLDELLAAPQAAGDERHHEYARTLRPLVLSELLSVKVLVEPANAQLEIDDEAVTATGSPRSVWLDPGPHRVHVFAPGHASHRASLRAERGRTEQWEIKLLALPGDAPPATERAKISSQPPAVRAPREPGQRSTFVRMAPWVSIGTGSLLLAGGVAAWVAAKDADDDFTEACPTLRRCDPALEETQRDVERYERLGTVLLASGGVLVAGGVVWQIITPSVTPQSRAAASDAWMVSARGQF